MEYYVARDADGILCMYTNIPERKDGYWEATNGNFYTISPRLFDVKWSDEPIKITIEIWNKK